MSTSPPSTTYWLSRVANAFSRAAPHYDARATAQRTIGKMIWLSLPPQAQYLLDLGCGTGDWTQRLASRYSHAHVIGIDIAPGMLAYAQKRYGHQITWQQGDAACLPLRSNSVDLVFSNLAIQWCQDTAAVMREIQRVLATGGQAHITTLLPGTLKEIATVWQRPEALLQTPDAAELRQAINRSGLTLVRQTIEWRRFHYPDLRAVMDSIKGVGAQVARPNASLTRRELHAAQARYETLREPQGLPVSYHCCALHLEKQR